MGASSTSSNKAGKSSNMQSLTEKLDPESNIGTSGGVISSTVSFGRVGTNPTQPFGSPKKNQGTFGKGGAVKKGPHTGYVSHNLITTPQPVKKFVKSPHALDLVMSKNPAINNLPTVQIPQDSGKKTEKIKEYEKEIENFQSQIAEKNTIMAHIDLQLLKLERDSQKSKKELEDIEKLIAKKQTEVLEHGGKEFEIQLEIKLSQKKLEVLQTLLSKAQQSNLLLQSKTSSDLMEKIKKGVESLSKEDKVLEGLHALNKVSDGIVKLFTDATSPIRTLEEVQKTLINPERLFDSFIESNGKALVGLLTTSSPGISSDLNSKTRNAGRSPKQSSVFLRDGTVIKVESASPMLNSRDSDSYKMAKLTSTLRSMFQEFVKEKEKATVAPLLTKKLSKALL